MRGRFFGVMVFVSGFCGAFAQPGQPWMNTTLSPDARADLLQAQMTRDEELILVDGISGVPWGGFHDPIPDAVKKALPRPVKPV